MSSDNLSPALIAGRDALVAQYTAYALRVVPQGTADSAAMFVAMERIIRRVHTKAPKTFVHVRLQPEHPQHTLDNPMFMWMTEHGKRPVGHVEAIPVDWYKLDKANHPAGVGYVMSGPFDQLLAIARKYYGKHELPQNWLAGQLSALVVAYARWVIEQYGEKAGETPIDRELLSCVEQFTKEVGVALCFDEVYFAGDPPVGIKQLNGGDTVRRPVWSDAHAEKVGGMRRNEWGTWEDA